MNLAFLKPYIPNFILNTRKQFLEKRLRMKALKEIARRNKAVTFSILEFQHMLRDLGIQRGDCLFVHSGIGSFNLVEGGASAILQSIEEAVGPQGHLVFPAFPDWGKTMLARTPFDSRQTASSMGTLAELFRAKPGVKRSLHPTHSVCAYGPRAAWIVTGHENSPYAFGKNSPFYKACLLKAKILTIGLTLRPTTLCHVYEDLLVPQFWLPVYDPETVEFEMIPAEGATFRYKGYFHSSLSGKRDCERMRDPLVKNGFMKSIKTDYSEMLVLDSRGLVLTCLNELLKGWSIYGKVSITPDQSRHVQSVISEVRREFDIFNPASLEKGTF